MSDSKKKYEDKFQFWEEQNFKQDVTVNNRILHMTPLTAVGIINRALLDIKDAQVGENLEAVKEWIFKMQK